MMNPRRGAPRHKRDRPLHTSEMITPVGPRRRIALRCSLSTHLALQPLLAHRQGADRIVGEAETLDAMEVLRLLQGEDAPNSAYYPTLQLYLTDPLIERAAQNCMPPHLLLRAAAVKVALSLSAPAPTKGEAVG